MSRQVYFENWQEQLESMLQELPDIAAGYPVNSFERQTLYEELDRLLQLARQVKERAPTDRDIIKSAVMPLIPHEALQLNAELVTRLSELFEIYRRFRTRLVWQDHTLRQEQ